MLMPFVAKLEHPDVLKLQTLMRLSGQVERSRKHGRFRTRWLDQISSFAGSFEVLFKVFIRLSRIVRRHCWHHKLSILTDLNQPTNEMTSIVYLKKQLRGYYELSTFCRDIFNPCFLFNYCFYIESVTLFMIKITHSEQTEFKKKKWNHLKYRWLKFLLSSHLSFGTCCRGWVCPSRGMYKSWKVKLSSHFAHN